MRFLRLLVPTLTFLALASPALAAKGGSLVPGGNTIAGPGNVSVAISSQTRVFTDPDGSTDACVTAVNTGRVDVTVSITGLNSPAVVVPARDTRSVCDKDIDAVDIVCGDSSSCAAQWRVDDN